MSSSNLLGIVALPGHKLTFHKRSNDGSGKCSFLKSDDLEQVLYCALYELNSVDKIELDKAEGRGQGYNQVDFRLKLDNIEYRAFTYVAHDTHKDDKLIPYTWYRDLVLAGAHYHNLPGYYIDSIAAIEASMDSNMERADKNAEILIALKKYDAAEVFSRSFKTLEILEIMTEKPW